MLSRRQLFGALLGAAGLTAAAPIASWGRRIAGWFGGLVAARWRGPAVAHPPRQASAEWDESPEELAVMARRELRRRPWLEVSYTDALGRDENLASPL